MTFHIEKEFHFSASHQLFGLPEDHQCARLHGHNYILKVGLYSQSLNSVGFVLDYGELSFVKTEVDLLDHRHLNDILTFNPTSEMICKYYAELFDTVLHDETHIEAIKVSLSETPKTWAHYIHFRESHARF